MDKKHYLIMKFELETLMVTRKWCVVVAETTHSSLGVGYGLAYAEKINKPVIILHRKAETKLSVMINGTDYFKNVNYYSSLAESERILKTRLNALN